jgi:hypothetical protein
MDSRKAAKTFFAIGVLCSLVMGCAATPPPAPPRQLTKEEAFQAREQRIQAAVSAAYLAGQDGFATGQSLHLMWCQRDTQEISDPTQRSAALRQCYVDWPQPQRPQVVTTNCVSYGAQVVCQSQ